MTVEVFERSAWLAQHREVRTLFQNVAAGRIQLRSANLWPEAGTLESTSEHQRGEWAKATTGTIGILRGSPGTGKTYTVAAGVKAILAGGLVGVGDIAIGAPTGKAAVRLTEQLQAAGLNMRARTWHSILGMGDGDGMFKHHEGNPFHYRVLIGDESSMLDTSLFCAIMRARPRGCHMLWVGDVNQLPPVGHGAPLRDLIAAGIPSGELVVIQRNSGGIVEACAAIRDGKKWDCGDNLKILPEPSPEDQLAAVVATIHQSGNRGLDKIWDCQVLVAVNAKSKLSRKAINKVLQDELNIDGESRPGCVFRVRDKVVCLKNGDYTLTSLGDDAADAQLNDRGEVRVANGELGEVVAVEDKSMIVKLTGPTRVVRVPRGQASKFDDPLADQDDAGNSDGGDGVGGSDNGSDDKPTATGCSWDLGYALSVHKAQGSEVPVAIVVLDEYPGARQICDRSWLYTAISRAKKCCVLVGMKSTADAMCRRVNIGKRKTFLRELVLRGLADQAMGDL